jgi:hypothetical protein
VTGACADSAVDVLNTRRSDHSTCHALCRDFEKAVFDVVLNADHKLMATESLLHVAAALNISVPGARNL